MLRFKKVTSVITATLMLWTPFMIPIASAETPTITQVQDNTEEIASILFGWNESLSLPLRTEYMMTKVFPTIPNDLSYPSEFREMVAAILKLNNFIQKESETDFVQKVVKEKFQQLDDLKVKVNDALKGLIPASDITSSTDFPDLIELSRKYSIDERTAMFFLAWDQITIDTNDLLLKAVEDLPQEVVDVLDLENLDSHVLTIIQSFETTASSNAISLTKAFIATAELLSAIVERPAFAADIITDLTDKFKSLSTPKKVGVAIAALVVVAGTVYVGSRVAGPVARVAALSPGTTIAVTSAIAGVSGVTVGSLGSALPQAGRGIISGIRVRDLSPVKLLSALKDKYAEIISKANGGTITIETNIGGELAKRVGGFFDILSKRTFPIRNIGDLERLAKQGVSAPDVARLIDLARKPAPYRPYEGIFEALKNINRDSVSGNVLIRSLGGGSGGHPEVFQQIFFRPASSGGGGGRVLGAAVAGAGTLVAAGNAEAAPLPPAPPLTAAPQLPLGTDQLSKDRSIPGLPSTTPPVAPPTSPDRVRFDLSAKTPVDPLSTPNFGAPGIGGAPTGGTGGGQVATPFANRTVTGGTTGGSSGTSGGSTGGTTGSTAPSGTVGDFLGSVRGGTPATSASLSGGGGTNPPPSAPAPDKPLTAQQVIDAAKSGQLNFGSAAPGGAAAPQGPQAPPVTVKEGQTLTINNVPQPPAPSFTPEGTSTNPQQRQFLTDVARFLSKGLVTDQPTTKVSSGSGVGPGNTTPLLDSRDIADLGPKRNGSVDDPENPASSSSNVVVAVPGVNLQNEIIRENSQIAGRDVSEVEQSLVSDTTPLDITTPVSGSGGTSSQTSSSQPTPSTVVAAAIPNVDFPSLKPTIFPDKPTLSLSSSEPAQCAPNHDPVPIASGNIPDICTRFTDQNLNVSCPLVSDESGQFRPVCSGYICRFRADIPSSGTCPLGLVTKPITNSEYACIQPPVSCTSVLGADTGTICNNEAREKALQDLQGSVTITRQVESGQSFCRENPASSLKLCQAGYTLQSCSTDSPDNFGYVCVADNPLNACTASNTSLLGSDGLDSCCKFGTSTSTAVTTDGVIKQEAVRTIKDGVFSFPEGTVPQL